MQREFADSLLKICTNPKLQEALDSILLEANQDLKSIESIQFYYTRIRTEFEELASDYSNSQSNIHANEIAENYRFFNEQLSYLWMHLISDWIWLNNLASYQLMY